MSVLDRHQKIVQMLRKSDEPISGSSLSKELGVSRQIIVQDINKLKEDGCPILSTPRGYLLDPAGRSKRIFKIHHSVEDTETELNLIVDLGAVVEDVFIFHKVYGEIRAKLGIASRRDASSFCESIKSGKSSPLMTATSGFHYHTVAAPDTETLDLVEEALKEHGFLAELMPYEPNALSESE